MVSCSRSFALLFTATALAGPAWPALAGPQSKTADAPATGLEEIVVTAMKRPELLRNIPDAIVAFTAKTIEQAGIKNITDVAAMVPNFSIVQSLAPGQESINIRGIGQVKNGEAPVAVVIDGVELASSAEITQDLFDVERIEVLKGPEGAVYGRNAIGGAINIVTRRPTNEFSGMVKLGYGTGNDFTGAAYLSGPIVKDKLLFRVTGSFRHFDGDIDNVTLNQKVNHENTKNFRVNLLATPAENVRIDLRYARLDTKSGAAWYTLVPPGVSINEPLPVNANNAGDATRILDDLSAKIDIDTSFATITSITAYSHIHKDLYEDFDFLPPDLLSARQPLRQSSWSEEFRLTSNNKGPFKWLAGVYYLHTNHDLDSEVYLDPGASGILVPFPITAPTLFIATRSTHHNKAYAAFGQASYKITPKVELSAALRYDIDDRNEYDRVAMADYSHSFKSLQPKFQASYFINESSMAYLSIGKGFRSGGFNPNNRITRVYKQETNWNYEIGAKLGFFQDRMRIDAAAFYTSIKDRQVYNLDLITAAQVIANPIPKAEVKGLELSITALPAKGLKLEGSLGLLDTKIKSYDTSLYVGLPIAGDYTGNKLPQTPSHSYSFAAQYEFRPVDEVRLTSRIEVNGSGGAYYWEIDNRDRRKEITLVNARLTAEYRGLSLTGYVTNLFKEKYNLEYVSQAFSGSPFGNYVLPAPDRRVGAEIKYRF